MGQKGERISYIGLLSSLAPSLPSCRFCARLLCSLCSAMLISGEMWGWRYVKFRRHCSVLTLLMIINTKYFILYKCYCCKNLVGERKWRTSADVTQAICWHKVFFWWWITFCLVLQGGREKGWELSGELWRWDQTFEHKRGHVDEVFCIIINNNRL